MKLFKKAKKGFTLVELVVVIAVIAILAAVTVGAYFGVTESAKNSQALQEGKAAHTNLLLIANDPADDVCTLSSTGLSFTSEEDVVDAISAAAGVTYYCDKAIDLKDATGAAQTAPTTQAYPFIDINPEKTQMTYWLDDGHKATFVITTGEQVK